MDEAKKVEDLAWALGRTVVVYGAVSRAVWARALGVLVAPNPAAARELLEAELTASDAERPA